MPVLFDPLLISLRQERYTHVQDIHVWDYPMSYENIATLVSIFHLLYQLSYLLYQMNQVFMLLLV